MALRVPGGLTCAVVMETKLRQYLAGTEVKVVCNVIALI